MIGGGCAGLSAATALVERGARVRVVEARSCLGGRSRSWTDPVTGDIEDNGQHLILGCYAEFLTFAARTGGIETVRFQDRLELVLCEPGGKTRILRPGPLPPPLDLLWGLLRFRGFPWSDLIAARRLLRVVRSGNEPPEGLDVERWLAGFGQSRAARRLLWDPLVLATLNLSPGEAPASLLSRVIDRALAAGPEASRIGFPTRGLGALVVDPAAEYLGRNGGEVFARAAVRSIDLDPEGRFRSASTRDGMRHEAASVVLALPPRETARLLPSYATGFGPLQAQRMSESPIVAVHAWFDRPVAEHAMAGLLDSSVHWVFDRGRIGGARPPGYVALVTSAADRFASLPPEEVLRESVRELARFLPRVRQARLLRFRVLKERSATPRLRPSILQIRPAARTAIPNLYLAGDWTDTGLPATLEGAAASGHRAAALVAAG